MFSLNLHPLEMNHVQARTGRILTIKPPIRIPIKFPVPMVALEVVFFWAPDSKFALEGSYKNELEFALEGELKNDPIFQFTLEEI